MKQERTRKYVEQDETRTYFLTEDHMNLFEKYLDGLTEKDEAIKPRDDSLYYIFPHVYGGGILVDLDYEEGILNMAGDSSSLGNLVSHIEGTRLGRLRAEGIFKAGKDPQ